MPFKGVIFARDLRIFFHGGFYYIAFASGLRCFRYRTQFGAFIRGVDRGQIADASCFQGYANSIVGGFLDISRPCVNAIQGAYGLRGINGYL